MIRLYNLRGGIGDVAPQAIFWRPLSYFTKKTRQAVDDLDVYRFATFEIGNWLRFDLRRYEGHPGLTATLYLSLSTDVRDIQHAIDRVIGEFDLPRLAVAWRRGQPFEYGTLHRQPQDRLREPEARLLALKVAALMPGYRATTEELIRGVPRLFSPSDIDLRPSRTRPLQPQWHQIIRNVISHRNAPAGPFAKGLAERTRRGLAVTEDGINYLRTVGYLA